MIGSLATESTVREPGANPGRSRRCEGRRSSATKPLAFGSYAITTRSGLYAAIASTFGVKPESAVVGAIFG
jgi:hypothetical protein